MSVLRSEKCLAMKSGNTDKHNGNSDVSQGRNNLMLICPNLLAIRSTADSSDHAIVVKLVSAILQLSVRIALSV
jgi:hypothetical protein